MKYRSLLFFLILLNLIGFTFTSSAQMKSCCEPDGIKLVSTVKQSAGTLKMIRILDSISTHANPEDFYLMNTQRAELIKKNWIKKRTHLKEQTSILNTVLNP